MSVRLFRLAGLKRISQDVILGGEFYQQKCNGVQVYTRGPTSRSILEILRCCGGGMDSRRQTATLDLAEGTTFTIWLPAAGQMPRLLAEPAGELPRGNGETVMIVDDEAALVAFAEETLAELGYEPVGFASSLAALQAFREEPMRFDLVLSDETMPDLTGTELAREIRQLRPGISIILMSGYGGVQLSERAQAAGVIDVLHKPLVRRDIAEPVARALQARG